MKGFAVSSFTALDTDHVVQCLFEQSRVILPEKRLLVAVLIRALADALKCTGRIRKEEPSKFPEWMKIMREAWAWVVIDPFTSMPGLFSFQWICEQLDICPKNLRKLVIESKKKQSKLIRPGGRAVYISIE